MDLFVIEFENNHTSITMNTIMSLERQSGLLIEMTDFKGGPEKSQDKKISLKHFVVPQNKSVFKE